MDRRKPVSGVGHRRKTPFTQTRSGRTHSGQALVEMALVTPILLLLVTGVVAVGWLMLDLNLLNHAAQEAAVAGAMNSGDSCGVALETARKVYPYTLSSSQCSVQGQYVEVTVRHTLPLNQLTPIWPSPLSLSATAKAVLR